MKARKWRFLLILFMVAGVCLLFASATSFAMPVLSANENEFFDDEQTFERPNYINKELVDTAYLDIQTAPAGMKQEILEARKIIINNTEWVADGQIGWIENVETGEIIRRLPTFSELFPGWDIPTIDESEFIQGDNIAVIDKPIVK